MNAYVFCTRSGGCPVKTGNRRRTAEASWRASDSFPSQKKQQNRSLSRRSLRAKAEGFST